MLNTMQHHTELYLKMLLQNKDTQKKSNQDLQLTFIYRRYIWLVKWHWKKANKQIQNVEYSLEALI